MFEKGPQLLERVLYSANASVVKEALFDLNLPRFRTIKHPRNRAVVHEPRAQPAPACAHACVMRKIRKKSLHTGGVVTMITHPYHAEKAGPETMNDLHPAFQQNGEVVRAVIGSIVCAHRVITKLKFLCLWKERKKMYSNNWGSTPITYRLYPRTFCFQSAVRRVRQCLVLRKALHRHSPSVHPSHLTIMYADPKDGRSSGEVGIIRQTQPFRGSVQGRSIPQEWAPFSGSPQTYQPTKRIL